MPLLDHFRTPLLERPPWESFVTMWAVSLARWLNNTFSREEYIAYPSIRFRGQIEADLAEREDRRGETTGGRTGAVPPPLQIIPAIFPGDMEIRVGKSRHDSSLCAVIELVSEGNKKEESERRAFVAKCVNYLRRGVGVVVVDLVTNRRTNFHNELLRVLAGPIPPPALPDAPTYVAAYRPVHRRTREANEIEIWPYPVRVGQPIPSAPLALRGGPLVVLPLELTYAEACRDLGL